MTTIVIPLSEAAHEQLKAKAEATGVAPEELARETLEEWLKRSADDFDRAAEYVLRKNEELYRRLA